MLKAIRQKVSSGMGRDVVWTFAMQMLIMLCSFVRTCQISSVMKGMKGCSSFSIPCIAHTSTA